MARAQTIKALERGLRVLDALQSKPISSLHDLHVETRISKPSLLRILNTLAQAGVVSRRLVDGHYRISAFGSVSRRGDRHGHVVEAAAPVLHKLCRKVLWPSDLMVPAGDHMEKRETSQAYSPFALGATRRNRVGQQISWLLTGVGRAYLAFCPPKERERVLEKLRRSKMPDNRLARESKRLDQILAETRARGYATRDPSFTGWQYGQAPTDDGLSAIAVPLVDGTRVHGSINILWIRTAFSIEEFAKRYLVDLQQAAAEIVQSLRDRPRPPR